MIQEIRVPDIGDFDAVDVIEVLVAAGSTVSVDDPLITLESDKASMDIPSPVAGLVKEVKIGVGDKTRAGEVIVIVEASAVEEAAPAPAPEPVAPPPAPVAETPAPAAPKPAPAPAPQAAAPPAAINSDAFRKSHASPQVRRFARTNGVDLSQITGSGKNGRITEDDVRRFMGMGGKPVTTPSGSSADGASAVAGDSMGIPAIPAMDWNKFGDTELVAMSRINKLSAAHLHRAWVNIPHVTQFEEADITELEAYRNTVKHKAKEQGFGLTPLVFVIKAVVAALKEYPRFNAAIAADGENFIYRKYYNIGIAVDTPDGLVVPVIRDCDKKSVFELAKELGDVSKRARDGKLKVTDMQGGCFSISSLGGIGGTQFTPIVNAPETAILGVSKAQERLARVDGEIVDRLMLPLAVSYDHRVIDGALGARFTAYLAYLLSDIRHILL